MDVEKRKIILVKYAMNKEAELGASWDVVWEKKESLSSWNGGHFLEAELRRCRVTRELFAPLLAWNVLCHMLTHGEHWFESHLQLSSISPSCHPTDHSAMSISLSYSRFQGN